MMKEDLSRKNIKFEYIDILENMRNLKEFLHYRDNNDNIFLEMKKEGKLGIPLVVIESDEGVKLIVDEYKADFINSI